MVKEYNKTVFKSVLILLLREIAILAQNDRHCQNLKEVT